MTARCEKQKRDPLKVEREIGRLLGKNTRAARLFDVKVTRADDGSARLVKDRSHAGLGDSEFRLLPAAYERH
jgi:hypothetical protein